MTRDRLLHPSNLPVPVLLLTMLLSSVSLAFSNDFFYFTDRGIILLFLLINKVGSL